MATIAKNNAFGEGSPSWNVSFPNGNLTAAEILAYLPHWLKSVDVINRFINNGGRSVTITYLLKQLRVMSSDDYAPNSTTVMMQYAMRRAGYDDWTIGTRHEHTADRVYDENSLYVGDFRPPRVTHPKTVSNRHKAKKEDLSRNKAAHPVPFKDLALHVRQHPSGDDALDLTRCVKYAVQHAKEKWLFPTDFEKLVKHLGGPLAVTHFHLDKQLFARYDKFISHSATRIPARYTQKWPTERKTKSSTKKVTNNNTKAKKKKVMRQSQDSAVTASPSPTVGKRTVDEIGGAQDEGGGKRRSSRRVKNAPVYVDKDEDVTVQSALSVSVYQYTPTDQAWHRTTTLLLATSPLLT